MVFLEIARAVFDYAAQSEEELDIHDGDLLFVLEKGSDGWDKVKKKAASDDDEEPEGLVPSNYIESATPTHQAKALYDYTKQTDEELSFKEDARLDVFDETDPDWTLVGFGGEYGFAPAIYIEPAASAATTSPPARDLAPAPPPMPARPQAADEPIPGEADYEPPSPPTASNPAAQLAGIIAQRTGGQTERTLASPPPPHQSHYDEPEEEPAPSLPRRPMSQQTPPASPPPPRVQFAAAPAEERYGVLPSPTTQTRSAPARWDDDHEHDEPMRSPGGFHLYSIHEMVSHMGKNKKMPTTLGINIGKGIIMISPEKSKDGPSKEWTAEKLTHYSIEGKHVFVELVRPSKSIDFHAGAKDTAQEIVGALGELAGAVRQEGLKEVLAASAGTGAAGQKRGQMRFEFMAQGDDEVTVAVGDEVIILDDTKSDEWWMVRRLKNGKQGVVPSSYVEVTGIVRTEAINGLEEARNTVEANRREEERLTKEAARKKRDGEVGPGVTLPDRTSSLAGDTRRTSMRGADKRSSKDSKAKPNQSRVRTWTDRSGTFRVEAEFIGLRDGKIHLHKNNGVKIAVPVSKMAVEDLEYVERATGASLDEDKPLSDIKRRNTQRQKESDRNGNSGAGASVQKKDEYDWFDFFLQCGVNPQICERYAGAFSRDQMGTEVLPDVNEQLLRTLGLKEGDILRVMKFLDNKYDRKNGSLSPSVPDDAGEGSAGGLFSGPGGALRNNTRKGRPAPAVQTNDVIDESAFKPKDESPARREAPVDVKATPLTSAPARQPTNGFDDDAWDIKPSRSQTPTVATPAPAPAPAAPTPPRPKVNDDIASLSITTPALQPTPAPQPAPAAAPAPAQQPAQQQPPVANQAIFDKIASLAPAARQQQPQPTGYQQPQATGYQRPAAPPQQMTGGLNPPPRAASAPGFPPQQTGFAASPLQQQLTGYQPQQPGQGQQQFQQQQTGFQPPQGYNPGFQQQNGIQAMQQNFPPLQPQPTGFLPQSNFGQQQAAQQYGMPQPNHQQQMFNGQQTGSPFADPTPRQPYQPIPSGLSNSFMPQQTGFQPSQPQQTGFQPSQPQQTGFQPSFNISQATGMHGFGGQQPQQVPQLPPQQTGGVFGPSQPLGLQAPAAPLVAQRTGPAPPVRFGVQAGAKPLMPQPTGRANLSKASKCLTIAKLQCTLTNLLS